jgi:hypothetical protein
MAFPSNLLEKRERKKRKEKSHPGKLDFQI